MVMAKGKQITASLFLYLYFSVFRLIHNQNAN